MTARTREQSTAGDIGAGVPQKLDRRRFIARDYAVLLTTIGVVAYLSLATSTFLTQANIANVLDQTVVIGLLAIGATLCIVSGVFDLTLSASLALSAVVTMHAVRHLGVPAGFTVGLAMGIAIGATTGCVVAVTRVNSFVATLALSIVYRGIAVVVSGGGIVSPRTDQLQDVQVLSRSSRLWDLTNAVLVLLVVFLAASVLLSATTFGRRVYASGGNSDAARLSGVRVGQIHVTVYVVSGVCSALAGLVLASRAGSAQPSMATGEELTAIAAAVIGGTSVFGGEGAVWRGLSGAVLLTLITNGFTLLGWNTTYLQVVQGALILVAVTVDRYLRQRRG